MRTDVALAAAGLRHRPVPWLLLALGVAVAVILPILAAGLRTEASTAAVRSALDAIPASSRAVLAVTSQDLRGPQLADVDTRVRSVFDGLRLGRTRQAMLFRPLAVGGQDVTVGAVDELADAVTITSGVSPRNCTPTTCEVLAVAVPGNPARIDDTAVTALGTLGLKVVGTAELTDPRLIGTGVVAPDLPLALGARPADLARLAALDAFGRRTAWVADVEGTGVVSTGVSVTTQRLADLATDAGVSGVPLTVQWPADVAAEAQQRADASASRFRVLGAGTGALVVGFCLCVAASLRRRQQLIGGLLARRGAGPVAVSVIVALQVAAAVLLGLVVGMVAGLVLVAVRARALHPAPVAGALADLSSVAPVLVATAIAAAVLTVALLRWPDRAGRVGDGVLTGLAVVAVGVSALLTTTARVTSGNGPAATTIVVLVVTVGILTARAWRPVLGGCARLVRGRRGAVGFVGLEVARRRPLLRLTTAGFLAAACCVVVVAGGYRQTLAQSAADQAAAQVPLDVAVQPSARVALPSSVVDLDQLRAVSPEVIVHPVISSAVRVFAGTPLAKGLPLVGIDPAALPAMHEFAATTGAGLTADELADRLRVPPVTDSLPALPAGAKVEVQVRGDTRDVTVLLWVGEAGGLERAVPLTATGAGLRGTLPAAGAGGLQLRAVEITESDEHLVHRQHGIGEGRTDRPLAGGTLQLGAVSVDGRPYRSDWSGWGSDQADVSPGAGTTLNARYRIGADRVIIGPGASRPIEPLPVAVDPDTAARAGTAVLAITVNGRSVPVRVVAVLPRFAAVGTSYLLADRSGVAALADRSAPGTAPVTQLWIEAPGSTLATVREALESSPAATATLRYRSDLASALATDPVAVRSAALLEVAGVVALVLGLLALAVGVRGDVVETAADQYALELDGLPPARLRAVVALRALLVLAVGVVLGALGGLGVVRVAVRLLVTGPGGAPVMPPLRVVTTPGLVASVVAAVVIGGVLAVAVTAASAYRSRLPDAPELDLR